MLRSLCFVRGVSSLSSERRCQSLGQGGYTGNHYVHIDSKKAVALSEVPGTLLTTGTYRRVRRLRTRERIEPEIPFLTLCK